MVGIALETCDCRLQIGYVDDVKFTCYTFEGIDSCMGLALVVGVIIAMDILKTTHTFITFGSGFCSCHFSWYWILWSSNVIGWVAFSLDGFYVCSVVVSL